MSLQVVSNGDRQCLAHRWFPRPAARWLLNFARWGEHILAGVGGAFILFSLCLELRVLVSNSMAPTLQGEQFETGDRVVLEKVSGWFREPRRWEVWFFFDNEGTPVAKRVVGLPGETVSLVDKRLRIDGEVLELPSYLKGLEYLSYGNLANRREVACENGYYLLGDASVDSYDSRYTGVVTRDRLRGRAWCIIGPEGRRGWVR